MQTIRYIFLFSWNVTQVFQILNYFQFQVYKSSIPRDFEEAYENDTLDSYRTSQDLSGLEKKVDLIFLNIAVTRNNILKHLRYWASK